MVADDEGSDLTDPQAALALLACPSDRRRLALDRVVDDHGHTAQAPGRATKHLRVDLLSPLPGAEHPDIPRVALLDEGLLGDLADVLANDEAQVVAPPADAWVAHAQTVDELAVLPGGVLGVVEVAALGEVVDEAAEIVHVVPVEPDRPLIEGSVRACGLGPDRNVLLLTEANRRGRVVDDDAEVAVGVGLGVLPDMAYHVHRVDPCPYLAVAGVWQALEVAGEASALDGELGAALRGAGDDATAPDLTVGFGPDSGRPL